MAGKLSNRDRIAQKAAEAAATAQEKQEKADKKAKSTPRAAPRKAGKGSAKTARSPGRIKIVWRVCNPAGVEVKSFPYAQEAEARAEAERMTTQLGRTHFVRRDEVPLSS
jgi:hypothetical protein